MKYPRILIAWFTGALFLTPSCIAAEQDSLNGLVEKGEVLIEQRAYTAGIAYLESVLAKDPNNARAMSSLLAAYDAYTKKLTEEGRLDQATAFLKKTEALLSEMEGFPPAQFTSDQHRSRSRIQRETTGIKSYLLKNSQEASAQLIKLNQGRELYNEAVNHFNRREYDLAEQLLHESIELDQTNPFAYELLGEIANLRQDLDAAAEYYKKAFEMNPDAKLRKRYEQLMREQHVDSKQQDYADQHFIIRYKRGGEFRGSEVRQVLRSAYREISRDLAHYPQYKVPVILYEEDEYQKLLGSTPHWSGAMYDGKIRLPVYGKDASEINLKKLIYHELTHSFVLDLSRMRCPVWLNEGLAQYQENKVNPIPLDPLVKAVRTDSLMSVAELMRTDVAQYSDQAQALLYYLESFSLAKYLIGQYRMYRIKQLLIAIGKGAPFEAAFEETLGRTIQDVADRWINELKTQHA